MKLVSTWFFVASVILGLALLTWATVDQLLGTRDLTFLTALFLWLGTGVPLILVGLVARKVRRSRSSLRPPPHYPDWMRDQGER